MILLAASTKDVASLNIAKQVLKRYPFKKTSETYQDNPVYFAEISAKKVNLVTLKEETVNAQSITDFSADLELVVFISRHSSASGTPTLSVHTPGNIGEAELGGLPRQVSISPANAMKDALKAMMQLKEEKKLDYKVSYECTHHGPSLKVPTMFVELGSSEKQWNDLKAAEAVAQATIEATSKFGTSKSTAVLGIGGPHYNEKFTKMALEGQAVFGHIIPKYAIPWVNAEILKQCVDRTLEEVDCAILDWKGIKGKDKPKLLETLQGINLRFKKA